MLETSHRPPRDAHLLAALAAPLAPAREPWYMCGAPTGHPDGWYIILRAGGRPQYLGRNVIFGQAAILELLRVPPEAQ